MDCVEVVPLRELLHRQAAEAERDDNRRQPQRSDPDNYAYEVTPERSFVPRATRELLEGDEIGEPLSRIPEVVVVVMPYN